MHPSRAQVAIAARYGEVLLYDDTAVKNQYRFPLGLGVVIDGEYYTRIVLPDNHCRHDEGDLRVDAGGL